jgi:excisionase family DNA binding protein
MYDRPYMRPTEAAAALGCSRQNVTRLIRAGQLRALNISASDRPTWRIVREDVHRFVEERTTEAQA